jgi:very-short-patch-repair endonuclease
MEQIKNWKVVKTKCGSNTRIYTKNCEWCGNYYEGRGAKFCGKSCAAKWGRATKDYSKSVFGCGENNPNYGGLTDIAKKKLSKIMIKRWKDGGFINCQFGRAETKLEKKTKDTLKELNYKHKQYYWLNKNGWNPKEYDFYIKDLNLLIEVDGAYWHSLPENVENDRYKNEFATEMNYGLIRIPEKDINKEYIKSAINDYRKKQGLEEIIFEESHI